VLSLQPLLRLYNRLSMGKHMPYSPSVLRWFSTIESRLGSSRFMSDYFKDPAAFGDAIFDLAPVTISCPQPLRRFGDGQGSAKWLCVNESLKPPCVVYSFGSNGDYAFEDAMLKETKCEVLCCCQKNKMGNPCAAALPAGGLLGGHSGVGGGHHRRRERQPTLRGAALG
jgi:hypothetical protein